MTEEVHITSLVVHAMPPRMQGIADFIATLPGAEVHASDPSGKLVVTLETASAGATLDLIARIQGTDGVITAALVYQHAETLENMNEEIDHADHAT